MLNIYIYIYIYIYVNLFPVIKSLPISLVGKTFNHSTAVNKRLQCIVKKALFLFFSRCLLITSLVTLRLEK